MNPENPTTLPRHAPRRSGQPQDLRRGERDRTAGAAEEAAAGAAGSLSESDSGMGVSPALKGTAGKASSTSTGGSVGNWKALLLGINIQAHN